MDIGSFLLGGLAGLAVLYALLYGIPVLRDLYRQWRVSRKSRAYWDMYRDLDVPTKVDASQIRAGKISAEGIRAKQPEEDQ